MQKLIFEEQSIRDYLQFINNSDAQLENSILEIQHFMS